MGDVLRPHPCFLQDLSFFIQQQTRVLIKLAVMFLQEDLYYPHPLIQDILWGTLHKVVEPFLMNWPGKKLREKSLCTAMEHIHYEDENTRYICIGPVNKVGLQFLLVLFFNKILLCMQGQSDNSFVIISL